MPAAIKSCQLRSGGAHWDRELARKEEEEEEDDEAEKTLLIKSSNPHLAGGKKNILKSPSRRRVSKFSEVTSPYSLGISFIALFSSSCSPRCFSLTSAMLVASAANFTPKLPHDWTVAVKCKGDFLRVGRPNRNY